MTYYIYTRNNGIAGCSELPLLDAENIEVSFEDFNLCREKGVNYFILQDGKIVSNPNYEAELAQKEAERIAVLSLTRGDVFRGLLQAKGVTRGQIRTMILENTVLTELQKELALIDFDEALNFYRGNILIDLLGLNLGISKEQLDRFFETNDYTELE